MKLLSFSHQGRSGYGAVVGDGIVDIGTAHPEYPTLTDFISSGDYGRRDAIVAALKPSLKLAAVAFEPVIPQPEKVICLSRNYMDHQKEAVAGGLVHGGEKTIQWSACVCAGAGGVKVGHWIG